MRSASHCDGPANDREMNTARQLATCTRVHVVNPFSFFFCRGTREASIRRARLPVPRSDCRWRTRPCEWEKVVSLSVREKRRGLGEGRDACSRTRRRRKWAIILCAESERAHVYRQPCWPTERPPRRRTTAPQQTSYYANTDTDTRTLHNTRKHGEMRRGCVMSTRLAATRCERA